MSEMFKIAHTGAKADMLWAKSNPFHAKPYAYFFRLHLISLQEEARIKRTGIASAFQVIDPRRVWA